MSRIGKQPIKIPSGIKVRAEGATMHFEGPKGKLSHTVPKGIKADIKDTNIVVAVDEVSKKTPALFGLTRTLLSNCVEGVSQGFTKILEINGIGYRAQAQGSVINLTLGFSHPVQFPLAEGLTAKVEKNTTLHIMGADKELVGRTAAKIKSLRPVEPYQGKGIRYRNEHVIRKQGKSAGTKS